MGKHKLKRKPRAWTPEDVIQITTNPLYAGVCGVPAILSREDWCRVNVKLADEVGRGRWTRLVTLHLTSLFHTRLPDAEREKRILAWGASVLASGVTMRTADAFLRLLDDMYEVITP